MSSMNSITQPAPVLPCPWCDRPSGSNTVHRVRYAETLSASPNVADFEGWIDECSECGIYWVNPRYHERDFAAYYTQLSTKRGTPLKRLAAAPTELLIRSWNSPSAPARLIAHALGKVLEPLAHPPVPPRGFVGGRVLDVGCGDGFHLRCYAKLGCELFGTEIHSGYAPMLERGPERIRFWIKPFTEIPWSGEGLLNSFDLIVFQSVFYRVNDPDRAHDLAWRLLRPGGTILRIEPYCPDLDALKFITKFNFPQGFTFIKDVEKHVTRLAAMSPGATFQHRVFYGRSLKHRSGRELSVARGALDAATRIYKQLASVEPWFVRLEITKPAVAAG